MLSLYKTVAEISGATQAESAKGRVSMRLPVALCCIRGQRCVELAEELGISSAGLTGMVDRMEKLGYVVRQPVEGDRRAFAVALTDLGREAVVKLYACVRAIAAACPAPLHVGREQEGAEDAEVGVGLAPLTILGGQDDGR